MKNGFKPKNKIKSKDLQRSPRILGLGLIKLDFYLNLTDEIIKKYKIDLNSINSPKDLAFIAEDTFLLDLIQISSSDTLSNILLFLNKANTSKSFVELITLSPLRFHPDEEHMKKIFTHVTEHNYLFSNEISVTNVANKLSFAIKNGKKLLRYFELNTDYDPFSDELSDEIKKETDEKMENLYKNNNEIKEVDEINEYKAKSFEKEDMGKSDMMNDINNENNFEKSKNIENEDEGNVNSKINEIEDNENNNLSKQIHDKDEYQEIKNNNQKENDLVNISEADINNNKNEILPNKNDELDFDMEIEEIKEKKSPKKKEISIPSYVEFPDEENSTNKNQQDKNLQPSSFREPFDKKSKPINSSQNQNEKNSLSKKDFLNNKNEDLKKTNRPVYESSDSKKYTTDDKSILKLVNIPAACEIEEYDFLFIDLEEFINFHANGLNLYEVAEFMKKISNNNKKPRIVVNYPNILISLNLVNLELLEIIISIISYTDIFLFEKKECLAFFSMLNQMNNEKDLSEKELIDYFFSEVPHQKNSVSKIALFLDELQVINVAEQKKEKIINNISYDIKLFPKINHYNHKLVEEYKKIMTLNNNYFKSIFFGGFFSSYIFYEDSYVSYLTGAETTKRILEIFKNKIDFPIDPEFYLVKLQKSIIEKRIDREKLRKKEEKFVLDCINKTNSLIKYYNPLFDDNLNAFFSSEIIRKQLKDKGFINTNGFVLYDSSYKNLLERPPKEKKRLDTSEREKHLLLAVKQNNGLLSNDLDIFSSSLRRQSPTSRKLPLPNLEINSSNLYVSAKLKNLKFNKKKLKPITNQNSSISNLLKQSKYNVNKTASIIDNKSNSKSPPKSFDSISKNKMDSVSKISKNLQKNKPNNINELLSASLIKERDDNLDYKDQSKLANISNNVSILENHNYSENDNNKSHVKNKNYNSSQKHTENNILENDQVVSNMKTNNNELEANEKDNNIENNLNNKEEDLSNHNIEENNNSIVEKEDKEGTIENQENEEKENEELNNEAENDQKNNVEPPMENNEDFKDSDNNVDNEEGKEEIEKKNEDKQGEQNNIES